MEPLEEAVPERLAQAEIDLAVSVARRVTENIRRAVEVKDEVLEHVTVSLLAEGHILVEDYPGVGKTALARALSRSIDCAFARVQCTADLLPADIVGSQIYNQREGRFEFRPGPIFANVVIVDEVNRASPKTQSGLLECMQERRVTVDVHTHELARPFMVLATQNPVEYEGTYPLPEAQVDRFMLKLRIGYPSREEERQILDRMAVTQNPQPVGSVVGTDEILRTRALVDQIYIDDKIKEYVVNIVFATREPKAYQLDLAPLIEYGASPRATLYLTLAAKAHAFLQGRGYVTPQDVKSIGPDVLRHRVIVSYEAEAEEIDADEIVKRVFDGVPVP